MPRKKRTPLEKRLAETDLVGQGVGKHMLQGGVEAQATRAGINYGWWRTVRILDAFTSDVKRRFGPEHLVAEVLVRARQDLYDGIKEMSREANSYNPFHEEEEAARQAERDRKEQNRINRNLDYYLVGDDEE